MSSFREKVLECNGLSIRYTDSGTGEAVVIFIEDNDNLFDDVTATLATHYRVIVINTPTSGVGKLHDFAASLAQALAGLGIASFSVIGVSQGAVLALAQAVSTPEQVQRLVLVSPPLPSIQHPELGTRLREIKAPTLVLVGTRDRSGSHDAGHSCREQISTCHLLLVYEAGRAIAVDRREACLSPISEFLEQGEGFIVFHESQMIRP